MLATKLSELSLTEDQFKSEIISSVQRTFSTIFSLDLIAGPASVVEDHTIEGDVSGLVNLVQGRCHGTLVLNFPAATICKLMSAMYGREFTSITKPVSQGAGELTNMVFGVLKTNLADCRFDMAIPNVIVGEKHTLKICTTGSTLILPFTSKVGTFTAMFVTLAE